jgi:hypothetical protein
MVAFKHLEAIMEKLEGENTEGLPGSNEDLSRKDGDHNKGQTATNESSN